MDNILHRSLMGNNNTKNYFCVTALEDGVTITTDAPIKYKINNNAWNSITNSNGGEIILSKTGDKAYFLKNDPNDNNPDGWKPHYGVSVNTGKKRTKVSGNIMSLIHSDDFEQNFYVGEKSFLDIFKNSGIVDASELILPATTLATNCYCGMFQGCTSLTSAPELPATTLANECYNSMFEDCTSLTETPAILPATTLAEGCYSYMFRNCTSLTSAPVLPAITLADYCYESMFQGCTSLTTAPELPATTLAKWCYAFMFEVCESLTAAPELPATTLFEYCYNHMFAYCFSLTKAPDLNATTLAKWCYNNMFYNCTSLTEIPAILPAITLFENCYSYMFNGCTSLTEAPELPSEILASSCYQSMFSGCTSLTSAPALPATTLASNCYQNMFSSCISLNKAPDLPAKTLISDCYTYMFSGTSLSSSPVLGAKKLVPRCYQGMFYGCSNLTEITMLANDISNASDALLYWVQSVGENGSFYKDYRLESGDETSYSSPYGIIGKGNSTKYDGIPYGWNIYAKDTYLFISFDSYWKLTTTTIYNETYEVYTWDTNYRDYQKHPIHVKCMGLDELTLYFKFTNEYDSVGDKQAYFTVSALDDADTIIFDTRNASLPTQNGEPLSEYYSITLTNIDSEELHNIYITYHNISWSATYIPTDGIFMVKRMKY